VAGPKAGVASLQWRGLGGGVICVCRERGAARRGGATQQPAGWLGELHVSHERPDLLHQRRCASTLPVLVCSCGRLRLSLCRVSCRTRARALALSLALSGCPAALQFQTGKSQWEFPADTGSEEPQRPVTATAAAAAPAPESEPEASGSTGALAREYSSSTVHTAMSKVRAQLQAERRRREQVRAKPCAPADGTASAVMPFSQPFPPLVVLSGDVTIPA
jgi:hypothetical protein